MCGGLTHARAVNCSGSSRTRVAGAPIGTLHTCVAPSRGMTSKKRPAGQPRSVTTGSFFHVSVSRTAVQEAARSVTVTCVVKVEQPFVDTVVVEVLSDAKRSVGPSHWTLEILHVDT
jgi:glutamate 5-kinase